MNVIALKRSLREMKRIERKIRFGAQTSAHPPLVWEQFFDLNGAGRGKYTLEALAAMSREAYQAVIAEYWSFVYHRVIGESDLHAACYNAGVLLKWGLPGDADEAAVKRRFRELAKRTHPDTGGDAKDFIRLMAEYKKLAGK